MKKLFIKIIEAVNGTSEKDGLLDMVLAILGAVFFVLILIVYIPVDYIRYKRSLYYKNERTKYSLMEGSGIMFELYNEIFSAGLPIEFVHNPVEDSVSSGWFVYDQTLIIPNVFCFTYDTDNGAWTYEVEDDEETKKCIMSLDEYIETSMQEANELTGETICSNAIVLIHAGSIENAELARNEDKFLIYDDNRVEVLKNFCNKN